MIFNFPKRMKQDIGRVASPLLAFLLTGGYLNSAEAPSSPALPNYTLECRTVTTNASKWGFFYTGSEDCPDRPICYKSISITETQSYNKTDDDETHAYELEAASSAVITSLTEGSWQSFTGHQTSTHTWESGGSVSNVADVVDTPDWTYGGYVAPLPSGGAFSPADTTYHDGVLIGTYSSLWFTTSYPSEGDPVSGIGFDPHCHIANPTFEYNNEYDVATQTITYTYEDGRYEVNIEDSGSNSGLEVNWSGSYSYSLTFSSEFTTPDLVDELSLSFSGDWSTHCDASPKAFVEFEPSALGLKDEATATGTAVEARFKVFANQDQQWEIPYVRWRIGYSNGNPVWTNRTEETKSGVGTGDWQYIDVPIDHPYWSYSEGSCTYYDKAEEWIELGCGACGGDCSSGICQSVPASMWGESSSIALYTSLGSGDYGRGSSRLAFIWDGPAPADITSASRLEVLGGFPDMGIFRNSGELSQIITPQVLTEIKEVSSIKLEIKCYDAEDYWDDFWYYGEGPFDTSGDTPISTGTIEQVSGSTNNIRFTVVKDGSTQIYDYTWSAANNGWTFVSGGGFRKEIRTRSESPLVLTHSILDGSNNVLFEEVERYAELPTGGNVLIAREVGAPGGGQTNRWVYYDDDENDGASYGKLKYVIEPSGFWTYYEYTTNGLVAREVSQFLNAATNAAESSCRVVEYDYTPIDGADTERRIEKLLNQEIGRSYTLDYGGTVKYIQCQTPGAAWIATDNLVTQTTYGADGEVWRTINPDGTIQLSTTATNASYMTNITVSGQPNGTQTAVVAGISNVVVSPASDQMSNGGYTATYDVATGLLISREDYSYDDLGRLKEVDYLDNTSILYGYDCCGIEKMTNRDGTITSYLYDDLKRQYATDVNGVISGQHLDPAGNPYQQFRVPDGGSEVVLLEMGYNTAGRLVAETNALEGVTTYSETFDGSGQTVRTTTYPDGGTRIETYYQDGSIKSVTGTAAFAAYYEYGVESEGGVQRAYTKEIKGSSGGNEWTKTYTDMAGRSYKTVYAASGGTPASESFYNNLGQLEKQVDPDGVTTLYAYNANGELDTTAIDLDADDEIDSDDRVTYTESDVLTLGGGAIWPSEIIRRTRTWQTNDSQVGVLVSESWASADGNRNASMAFGLTNQSIIVYTPGSQQRTVTSIAPDETSTVSVYANGRLSTVTRFAEDGYTQLARTTYGYDTHGRQYQMTDVRNGTSTYTYNAADLVESVTTPDPDDAGPASAQVTTTYYDNSLRATNVVHADNTHTYTTYYPNGLLKKTWGSRTYPVEYAYDYAGRMTNMTTWQDYSGNSGKAYTTWIYNPYRGWLDGKRDNDNKGADYTYTAAGRLDSRTWARGISTDYGYNNAGVLASVDYSDTTPDIGYGYDRRGRQTTVTNSGTLWITKGYNDAGALLSETYSGGPLSGLAVTNGYDTLLRRTKLALLSGATELESTDYSYDSNSGRLDTVSDGTHSAEYDYLANSPLVEQIQFKQSTSTRMTTIKAYDYLNRLTNSVSSAGGSNVVSFRYVYNSANQRTSVTNVDGSYWVYEYDALGQVESGKKYWSDGTPVAGQQFTYGFDDIGNRETAASGGDQYGGNLRYQIYTADLLNQYSSRTVPDVVGVSGTATNTATVTVNFEPTERKGDYWWGEAPAENAGGPLWLGITNIAVLNDGASPDIIATNFGHVYVPQSPETFTYDDDGNLTGDSLWANTWNGENRRTTIESRTGVPTAGKVKEQWTYLPDGRWVERIVSTNNGSSYYPAYTNRYVWDGNVLLAVLDEANAVEVSFTRGLDLSGSQQGAGGTGGLLWVTATGEGTHFVCFDGNGNVMALVDASDSSESARYEYGPFSENIRATGPMAQINPNRFSTQYTDDVTGDRKYKHRDLDVDTGRWPSLDPLGEIGADAICGFWEEDLVDDGRDSNPYRFAINAPVSFIDRFGLAIAGSLADDAPRDCGCKCISVMITWTPGGESLEPDMHLYPSGDYFFGAVITIAWKVDGDPSKCHYFYKEKDGGVWGSGPRGKRNPSDGSPNEDWAETGQVKNDAMGWLAEGPGEYFIRFNVTQSYKCISADPTDVVEVGPKTYRKRFKKTWP